jgi:quercetin dioxygenase-like cupin family protein
VARLDTEELVKIVRISHDEHGGSRSSDVDVDFDPRPFAAGVPALLVSGATPARAVSFVEFPAEVRETAPHPTPRRQLGAVLSGTAETETTDGEVRRLTAGSVVLVEDTEGRGHITRVVERPFRIMFVALEE